MKHARDLDENEQDASDAPRFDGRRRLFPPAEFESCAQEKLIMMGTIGTVPEREPKLRSETSIEMEIDQDVCNVLGSFSGVSSSADDEVQVRSRLQPEVDHPHSPKEPHESRCAPLVNIDIYPGCTASGAKQDGVVCYGMVRVRLGISSLDLCLTHMRSLESSVNALTRRAVLYAAIAHQHLAIRSIRI